MTLMSRVGGSVSKRRIQGIDVLAGVLAPQLALLARMDMLFAPQLAQLARMDKLFAPQLALHARMDKLFAPQRDLFARLDKLLATPLALQAQMAEVLKPLDQYFSDPMLESVSVAPDGSVAVSGAAVDIEEMSKTVEQISLEHSSVEGFIGAIFSWLDSLRRPARAIAIHLLLPFFVSIVAGLSIPYFEEARSAYGNVDKRAVKKHLVQEAAKTLSPEILRDYRFVYATELHVRREGNMSAPIVDHLGLGVMVKAVRRAKSWTLIEYPSSASGQSRRGWVFSRYLKKFEK